MVIDTSVLIAILLDEPGAMTFVDAIAVAATRRVGAPTLVEAAAVMLARKGPNGGIALDALLQRLEIEVVPMSVDAAALARSAYARFGKGIGAPAVLNYGDCLAYGVAVDMREPLLFAGEDFRKTDVVAAEYRASAGHSERAQRVEESLAATERPGAREGLGPPTTR